MEKYKNDMTSEVAYKGWRKEFLVKRSIRGVKSLTIKWKYYLNMIYIRHIRRPTYSKYVT